MLIYYRLKAPRYEAVPPRSGGAMQQLKILPAVSYCQSSRVEELQLGLLLIRKFLRGLYFRETSHMQSFVKIKPSRNGKITISFIDIGKSCLSHEFFTSPICLLVLFSKI